MRRLTLAPPIVPSCRCLDDEVTHGVASDANGRVTLNLFQTDYDTSGWWVLGPLLWIPKPVLPRAPPA